MSNLLHRSVLAASALSDRENRTCPSCKKEFANTKGLLSHWAQAVKCKHYRKGKNRAMVEDEDELQGEDLAYEMDVDELDEPRAGRAGFGEEGSGGADGRGGVEEEHNDNEGGEEEDEDLEALAEEWEDYNSRHFIPPPLRQSSEPPPPDEPGPSRTTSLSHTHGPNSPRAV
ncbi:hypothetical protein BV25DRAFT_1843285 [Artomyces pyxidatus]|uniref:Uncharacterized protein n=1 Tax=Artomyces pyxidatus TaxID=48021 RepID=A0ACB8SEL1_9AGAM|nr:hypothetical protein BV25DRAFT_1843285 [Artomyces pyxidatus]